MLNLDIPLVTSLSGLLSVLNDRLRMIAAALGAAATDDEDLGGHRIVNLGDGAAPTDALNIRTADRRYATTTAVQQQIQQAVSKTSTTVVAKASPSSASGGALILTVPGTLAIESQAAALVTLPADTAFTTAVAILKQAPAGASLVLSISAGAQLGTVTVGDGKTTATVDASKWKTAPKETVISVDITSVGLTFPGADLTLELRY